MDGTAVPGTIRDRISQPMKAASGQRLEGDDGFVLPHFRTFSAISGAAAKTYRYTWDEAVKDSAENVLAMRRDPFIIGCLQERYLQLAQLKWELEPEDQRDKTQIAVTKHLTNIARATRAWHHFTMQLAEAAWYGRYANQIRWEAKRVMGKPALCAVEHRPVNGDKIQFGWDGIPRILINSQFTSDLRQRGAVIEQIDGNKQIDNAAGQVLYGDRAPMLVLGDPRWRQRFVIHKHIPSDADFFDGEMAGGVHGVGLRSQIYWLWALRDEMLGWALNHLKKIGVGGILIFYYEEGNEKAKAAANVAAKDAGERYALAMPRPRGSSKDVNGAEMLAFNEAGVKSLTEIISDYFERHIERLIIGQTLSSKTEGNQLGGTGVASLHANTKFRILGYDAENLGDTLTHDFISVIHQYNSPETFGHFNVRFKFNVPDPDAPDKLKASETLYKMRVPMKAEEIRGASGLSKPEADDETVVDQSPLPGTMPPGAGSPPQPGNAQAAQDALPAPAAGPPPKLPGAEHLPPHGTPTIPGQEHLASGEGVSADAPAGSTLTPVKVEPAIPGAELLPAHGAIPGQENLPPALTEPDEVQETDDNGEPVIPGQELLSPEAGVEPVRAPEAPALPGAEHIGQKIIPGQELLGVTEQPNDTLSDTSSDTSAPAIPGAELLGDSGEDDARAALRELAEALLADVGEDLDAEPVGAPASIDDVDALTDEVLRLLEGV